MCLQFQSNFGIYSHLPHFYVYIFSSSEKFGSYKSHNIHLVFSMPVQIQFSNHMSHPLCLNFSIHGSSFRPSKATSQAVVSLIILFCMFKSFSPITFCILKGMVLKFVLLLFRMTSEVLCMLAVRVSYMICGAWCKIKMQGHSGGRKVNLLFLIATITTMFDWVTPQDCNSKLRHTWYLDQVCKKSLPPSYILWHCQPRTR